MTKTATLLGELEACARADISYLKENDFHHRVWPYLSENTTLEERKEGLKQAFEAFVSTGVTGAIDMAMMEDSLEALEELYEDYGKCLPIRLNCHWFVNSMGTPEDHAKAVHKAAEHRERLKDKAPWLNIVGIKVMSDGVVDACVSAQWRTKLTLLDCLHEGPVPRGREP